MIGEQDCFLNLDNNYIVLSIKCGEILNYYYEI